MATNFLLKLEGGGIKGESPVHGFTDYIEILSYGFGATQTGTFDYGQGGGGGKVSMDDFSFVMKTNKASPKLMEACANGTAVKTATLVCRKAGGKSPVEFLKVVMTDCLISSHETGTLSSSIGQSVSSGQTGSTGRPASPFIVTDSPGHLGGRNDGAAAGIVHDDVPFCFISLNFAKIVVTYKDQKADGSPGAAVEGGWDQKKQKAGK